MPNSGVSSFHLSFCSIQLNGPTVLIAGGMKSKGKPSSDVFLMDISNADSRSDPLLPLKIEKPTDAGIGRAANFERENPMCGVATDGATGIKDIVITGNYSC